MAAGAGGNGVGGGGAVAGGGDGYDGDGGSDGGDCGDDADVVTVMREGVRCRAVAQGGGERAAAHLQSHP